MAEEKSLRRYQIINGYKMPKTFMPESIISTLQYKPKPDDLFLVTFPRCGTTWAQQILYLIFHKGAPPKDGKDLMVFSPYLELMGVETAIAASGPCILKVHLPFQLTPYSSKAKYIYVARNPKDCCVSYYHFITKTVSTINITFDEFFEYFIAGDIPYESYFDHVLSWYNHRNDSNVLFVTYEEMKRDFFTVVKKICTFLGEEYSTLIDNDEIKQNIYRFSTFEFMKNTTNENMKSVRETANDEDLGKLNAVWHKRKVVDDNFVRKGEMGDWKNYFSSDQNQKMDELIQSKFGDTELLGYWKDIGLL